jgi:hypothetical protein
MPWVRRSHQSFRLYWIAAIVAGVVVGVLIGYERWGSTAAVVSIVEKELATSQEHITVLEKKVAAMEAKLGVSDDVNDGEAASARQTVLSKPSVPDVSYHQSKTETEKTEVRAETY